MEELEQMRERYNATEGAASEGEARLSEAAERVRIKTQEFWEDTTDLIRAHPGAAVGVALVAGVALGTLLGNQLGQGPTVAETASDRLGDAKERLSSTLTHLRGLLDEAIRKMEL